MKLKALFEIRDWMHKNGALDTDSISFNKDRGPTGIRHIFQCIKQDIELEAIATSNGKIFFSKTEKSRNFESEK